MLAKAALGVYTRTVAAIEDQADVERELAWQRYCHQLDVIAARVHARTRPHWWRYLESISHAKGAYLAALQQQHAQLVDQVKADYLDRWVAG